MGVLENKLRFHRRKATCLRSMDKARLAGATAAKRTRCRGQVSTQAGAPGLPSEPALSGRRAGSGPMRFPRRLALLLGAKAGSSTGPWGEARLPWHAATWEVIVMANRWVHHCVNELALHASQSPERVAVVLAELQLDLLEPLLCLLPEGSSRFVYQRCLDVIDVPLCKLKRPQLFRIIPLLVVLLGFRRP